MSPFMKDKHEAGVAQQCARPSHPHAVRLAVEGIAVPRKRRDLSGLAGHVVGRVGDSLTQKAHGHELPVEIAERRTVA